MPALVTSAGPDFFNTLRVAAVAANVVVALSLGVVFARRRNAGGRGLPLSPLH
jgi:hypothetical protein